jgi:hypothetical protein
MDIKVIGPVCKSCKKLLELTKNAVKEMKVDTNIIYITDMAEIIFTHYMEVKFE